VFCQLVYLRRCIPGRILRALNELPETLDKTYARTLEEIDEQNWEYAHRLFQCVAAASRPLLVNELAEFLAFDFEAGSTPTFLADWRPEDPEHTVLSTCSSLLTVVKTDDGSPVVQFAHFSVKEYLTSARLAKAQETISRFQVSMTAAHTIVAQACLGVLLHLDENITSDSLEKFPFAEYAAEHWMGHALYENVLSKVQDGMKRLFDPRKSHFSVWVWVWVCDPEYPWFRSLRPERPEKTRATPLHYAVFCGMHDVATFLIIDCSQNVNAQGFVVKETPLHVAARYGRVDIAQLLLEHGADADAKAQSDNNNTPLHLASQGGHVEVAEVFIDHGAATDARNYMNYTPLLLASKVGHVEIARVLLENGAAMDARNYANRTPLVLASQYGHAEVVRVLLEHGADTEDRCMSDSNPLHWASMGGHVEVARVLLEHGVDVKSQDRSNKTALHWAQGKKVAQLLLKHGADANAIDIRRRTPLHHASEDGHVGVARVLLEHGVDANAQDADNLTPLHLASSDGRYPDVIRLLLQYGSDIHAWSGKRQTPLMKATAAGNHSIMQLLLEHGAEDHRLEAFSGAVNDCHDLG
jgi:ankyrin repeat protein